VRHLTPSAISSIWALLVSMTTTCRGFRRCRWAEYDHPIHGKIKFTTERLHTFAQNVKNKVRGTDLDIDYDHKAKTDEGRWLGS
jgi:hypothetical protein